MTANPEVQILGPLRVVRDGATVDLRGRVLPRLLALLAIHFGDVVSHGALADALWEREPPATARRQIQNAVSVLRRTLGGRFVETVGHGYRLNLELATLDARRFTKAVLATRRSTANGDIDGAVGELAEALRLWRGPALHGIAFPHPPATIRHLEEMRLATIEEHAELSLRLGRSVGVPGLRELTRAHPDRQRLAAAFMLALHRDGRTGAALAVYEETRDRLAEELGIDPGPLLRERHAELTGAAPASGPVAANVPVPAQLPADIAGFTGREAQLKRLDALPAGATTAVLSTVSGAGGAGKTALTLHWAHRNRYRFADGQLYVNLRGFDDGEPVSAIDALGRFLTALGVPGDGVPGDVETAPGLYRSILADKRVLVILDNARSVDQVSPLIPGGDGNLAIVTSRNRLTGLTVLHGAHAVTVEPLARDESLRLLTHLLGTELVATEPGPVGRLIELCGGLPLALRIAAANFAVRPGTGLARFVAELDGAERLDLLAVDGDPRAAVASVIDRSVAVLDDETRSAFLRLGLLPCDTLTAEVVAAVLDVPVPAATDLLRRLISAHLVEQHAPTRFRLHDLVRAFARARAAGALPPEVREFAVDRCIRWYFDHRAAADRAEYPNLVAAINAWRDRADCWRPVVALSFLISGGTDLAEIRRHVDRGLSDAERRSDVEGQYHMHSALARIRIAAGDADGCVAAGERALASARRLGGHDLSVANANLGAFVSYQGDYTRGERYLREALREFEAREDPQLAPVSTNLANACRRLGRFAEAESLLLRSERHYREKANRAGVLNARIGLGLVDLNTGELDRAVARFGDGLARALDLGANRYEMLCHLGLGLAYATLGRAGDGERELRLALEQAVTAELDGDVNKARVGLAMLLARLDRTAEALELLGGPETTDLSAMGVGRRLDHALASCVVSARAGRLERAVEDGELARELAVRSRLPLDEAHTPSALAEARSRAGNEDAARELRDRALAIFAGLGVRAETSVR